jgi:tetratricopeptide (TPR) repeat protein
MDAALKAVERAVLHARRIGLPHIEWWALQVLGAARLFGPTPVSQLLAWLDGQEGRGVRPPIQSYRAHALAMIGRFEDARTLLAELRAHLVDRGARISLGLATGHVSVNVELLAGDPAKAAEFGKEGCRLLEELGERGWLSTAAGMLGQALYALDQLEEAQASASRGAELGAHDDAITQMLWRQVKAKVLARRGEFAEAERLAREAVAVGDETDLLEARGNAYADLAEVLGLTGKTDAVPTALERALELYEQKGNVVMAERTKARLAQLL